jgi:hypothetical protein
MEGRMAGNKKALVKRIRHLDRAISDLGGKGFAGAMENLIRNPRWTTLIESAFVNASIESLQMHVDAVKHHYARLISISERIGKK